MSEDVCATVGLLNQQLASIIHPKRKVHILNKLSHAVSE